MAAMTASNRESAGFVAVPVQLSLDRSLFDMIFSNVVPIKLARFAPPGPCMPVEVKYSTYKNKVKSTRNQMLYINFSLTSSCRASELSASSSSSALSSAIE